MGVSATWQQSGSPLQSATVLFNEPTKPIEQFGMEYQPEAWEMEYRQEQFEGLYESVRQGGYEQVVIQGRTFAVREVTLLHDGLTYRAKLQEQL